MIRTSHYSNITHLISSKAMHQSPNSRYVNMLQLRNNNTRTLFRMLSHLNKLHLTRQLTRYQHHPSRRLRTPHVIRMNMQIGQQRHHTRQIRIILSTGRNNIINRITIQVGHYRLPRDFSQRITHNTLNNFSRLHNRSTRHRVANMIRSPRNSRTRSSNRNNNRHNRRFPPRHRVPSTTISKNRT